MNEPLLSSHPGESHVTKVIHLSLSVCNAFRSDEVSCRLYLGMYIVTWDKNPFKPLIHIFVVLSSPNLNIALMLVPVDAKKLSLLVFVKVEEVL